MRNWACVRAGGDTLSAVRTEKAESVFALGVHTRTHQPNTHTRIHTFTHTLARTHAHTAATINEDMGLTPDWSVPLASGGSGYTFNYLHPASSSKFLVTVFFQHERGLIR